MLTRAFARICRALEAKAAGDARLPRRRSDRQVVEQRLEFFIDRHPRRALGARNRDASGRPQPLHKAAQFRGRFGASSSAFDDSARRSMYVLSAVQSTASSLRSPLGFL